MGDSDSDDFEDHFYRPLHLHNSPRAPHAAAPPAPPAAAAPPPEPARTAGDIFDEEQRLHLLSKYLPEPPPASRQSSLLAAKAQLLADAREAHLRELQEDARRATAEAFEGLRRFMLDSLAARLAAELKRLELTQRLRDEAMAARLASEVRLLPPAAASGAPLPLPLTLQRPLRTPRAPHLYAGRY